MVRNQKQNSLKEMVISHPLTFIISTIIFTISITSAVFIYDRNKLIMYHNLIVENYKLENQRLEKIIDQRDKINNLDSIANSLRNILANQTKIVSPKHSNNPVTINQNKVIRKWDALINNAIINGESLLTLDPTESKTFELFNSWRNECLAFLKQIDIELSTSYANDFSILTNKLERADYQQLRTKVNDGLTIIKVIQTLTLKFN